jgi:hypothetical protein
VLAGHIFAHTIIANFSFDLNSVFFWDIALFTKVTSVSMCHWNNICKTIVARKRPWANEKIVALKFFLSKRNTNTKNVATR